MALRTKAALLLAALSTASTLVACRAAPMRQSSSTPTAGLSSLPTPESTPSVASPGGVEVALAAIPWPEGPAVARVNGTDIPTDAWREEITRQLRLVTAQYQVDWNDKASVERLPSFLDRELERMITLELMKQIAAREGIAISDADVQKEVENARQKILAGGQYKDLDAFMEANELTPERFEAMVREQVLANRLLAAHGGPDEVEHVHARQILLTDEETAKEVLARLEAGEKFEALAGEYSVDMSKEEGGDLGWIAPGTMSAEVDQAAFALQPGQTSGIVKSDFGYHIIRVDERAVRKLEEPLLSQVRQRVFAEWLEGQKKAAGIERLYTAAPAATPTPQP